MCDCMFNNAARQTKAEIYKADSPKRRRK